MGEDADVDRVDPVIKSSNSRQNEKLYAVEGVLNTKLRKAEKKRRKKANKLALMEGDDDESMNDVKNESGNGMNVDEGDDDVSVKEVTNNRFALADLDVEL